MTDTLDVKALLMEALITQDDARPRTQQVEIGPSALGGCSRQAWYRANRTEPINYTMRLPSMMGTAIHNSIENAVKGLGRAGYFTEIEVPGIPGVVGPAHIDLYSETDRHVIDWKTMKKYALRYFPKPQQLWQVSVYGYLLKQAGYEVDLLSLVAIPRDGTEEDIKVHTVQYDEDLALEALEWGRRVNEAKEPPPPEMSGKFCQDYCPFYGPELCLGK